VKLLAAVHEHTDREDRFRARLAGFDVQDRHGVSSGRRQSAMDRMKRRRGGHV
jgi:hypothetical protein